MATSIVLYLLPILNPKSYDGKASNCRLYRYPIAAFIGFLQLLSIGGQDTFGG